MVPIIMKCAIPTEIINTTLVKHSRNFFDSVTNAHTNCRTKCGGLRNHNLNVNLERNPNCHSYLGEFVWRKRMNDDSSMKFLVTLLYTNKLHNLTNISFQSILQYFCMKNKKSCSNPKETSGVI